MLCYAMLYILYMFYVSSFGFEVQKIEELEWQNAGLEKDLELLRSSE